MSLGTVPAMVFLMEIWWLVTILNARSNGTILAVWVLPQDPIPLILGFVRFACEVHRTVLVSAFFTAPNKAKLPIASSPGVCLLAY